MGYAALDSPTMAFSEKPGKEPTSGPVSNDMGQHRRQEKFEILIQGLSTDLYRYAYWLCRDRIQAEELVQETYLRAWKAIDSLRDADSAKSWLFTIFRREYARQFERKRLEIQEPADTRRLGRFTCRTRRATRSANGCARPIRSTGRRRPASG